MSTWLVHTNWFNAEFKELGQMGRAAAKDYGRLLAALDAWAKSDYPWLGCPGLDEFKPIEGLPQSKKVWEAVHNRSHRKHEGVHGYRLFYCRAREPNERQREAVILLKLWAKSGKYTHDHIVKEVQERYLAVQDLIDQGEFFP